MCHIQFDALNCSANVRNPLAIQAGQLEQRLRAAQTALDAAELKLVNFTNEMKCVLSAASKHFSIPVFHADSLIAQLLKNPPLVEAVPPATDDRRLKRKFGRRRNQLRRSERSTESLRSQLRPTASGTENRRVPASEKATRVGD
jgi:hypothetical protein